VPEANAPFPKSSLQALFVCAGRACLSELNTLAYDTYSRARVAHVHLHIQVPNSTGT